MEELLEKKPAKKQTRTKKETEKEATKKTGVKGKVQSSITKTTKTPSKQTKKQTTKKDTTKKTGVKEKNKSTATKKTKERKVIEKKKDPTATKEVEKTASMKTKKQMQENKNNKTTKIKSANNKKNTTTNKVAKAKKEHAKKETFPKEELDNEKTKIVKIKLLAGALVLVLLTILITFLHLGWASSIKTNLAMKKLSIESMELENNSLNITSKSTFSNKDKWCQIMDENEEVDEKAWVKVENDRCVLKINENSKYIVLKDVKNNTKKILISDYLNTIISLDLNKDRIILLQGETKNIEVAIKSIGNVDKELEFIVENNEIVQIKGTTITGLKAGKTNIIIKDKYKHELVKPVVVTNLVTLPQLNSNKKFLTANLYTEDEAHLLDEILEDRVDEAGLKTRAGAVAAARFLTLEFKYKVPYFLENGRFQKTGFSDQIDGEGRYYHKGLYLSKDKYTDIKRSSYKPVMWGGTLRERSNDRNMKNGLDCSGFVTWALYNGGYDPGDIGAGPKAHFITLPDLGISQKITLNLLKSGKVKAGDLIGWNGHIGMIIGIDEENVYIADTVYYQKGLVATKYTYKGLVNSKFSNIYDMSDYYKEDGNYTAMW